MSDCGKHHTTGSYTRKNQVFDALSTKDHLKFSKRESSDSAFDDDDFIFCWSNIRMNSRALVISHKNSILLNRSEDSVVFADLWIPLAESAADINDRYACCARSGNQRKAASAFLRQSIQADVA